MKSKKPTTNPYGCRGREDDPRRWGGQDADDDVAQRVAGYRVDVDDDLPLALLALSGQQQPRSAYFAAVQDEQDVISRTVISCVTNLAAPTVTSFSGPAALDSSSGRRWMSRRSFAVMW